MNIDYKPFDNIKFIYPVESGIYSSREFNYSYKNGNSYAVSNYYLDGDEGILLAARDIKLFPAASGYAFKPVSVHDDEATYLFWSEFKDCWHIKGMKLSGESKMDIAPFFTDIQNNIFVHSACIDNNGDILLACERMQGHLSCDIVILKYSGNTWSISKRINSGTGFCQRPRITGNDECKYVVWDEYCENGYDIFLSICKQDLWSGPIQITDSCDWHLNPSIAINEKGTLWITWLKNSDVERDGVLSKTNEVMMAKYYQNKLEYIQGNKEAESILKLNQGLLPRARYFGYHGLRRNPQIAYCENGDIGLFWEMQRSEEEVWENVENGYFLCMFFNGTEWTPPYIIQDGGSCFFIDSSNAINDAIYYAYRGDRASGTDIKFAKIKRSALHTFGIPHYAEWDLWNKVSLPVDTVIHDKPDEYNLYWGDMHCHSIYSPDAEGYPDELFFYARDKAGIAFCAITDNDIYGENILTKSALRYMQSLSDNLSEDGVFQAYTGFEWTFHRAGSPEPDNFNHRTVVFLDENQTTASRGNAKGMDESLFVGTLRDSNTIWHAHHGVWRILDAEHDSNVEIISAWDNNIEKFGTVKRHLDAGNIFGFMGASDNHRFIPGNGGALTGVYARELTKKALEENLLRRKNYATSGNKTILDFRVNGKTMGEVLTIDSNSEIVLEIRVKAERNIEYAVILYNGNIYKNYFLAKKCLKKKICLPSVNSGGYFYVKVKLEGPDREYPHNLASAHGNYVYSSPIWIKLIGNK